MTAPTRDLRPARSFLGFRFRWLDLHDGQGATYLRRRGVEHERLGGVLVHRIDGPDPGVDLHDHPWPFLSVVLRGGYTEEAVGIREAVRNADGEVRYDATSGHVEVSFHEPGHLAEVRTWRRWSVHRMGLDVAHRITAVEPDTITLVVRLPRRRTWGFYLPSGWVPWDQYPTDRRPGGARSSKPEENTIAGDPAGPTPQEPPCR